MSEYQYYEFLAVDRTLTPKQIEEVRRFSSRADISSTRFVNEYNWGDFRGDPDEFLSRGSTSWFSLPVGELRAAADTLRKTREAAERERAARERARRDAERAAAREQHLQELTTRQDQAWREVESLIEVRQSKAYEEAVSTLRDLRDVAIRQDALKSFVARARTLRDTHRAKVNFVKRLDKFGLLQT